MTICWNCGRNMCNFNVRYCSVRCRYGPKRPISQLSMMCKYPPLEANIGLGRPQGSEVVTVENSPSPKFTLESR